MKNKPDKYKAKKSRRSFLQSIGFTVAAYSMLPSFLWGSGRKMGFDKFAQATSNVVLPYGVSANWDLNNAFHETSPTRQRICINGLWKWQPGTTTSEALPSENWGYFKVPGSWPGVSNYMQKESQQVFVHPSWDIKSLNSTGVAWYQREINIPADWSNRRILLTVDYVNSSSIVYLNGMRLGEILFPSGELELTIACSPGKKYLLTMKVTALPLSDIVAIYSDSNAPRQGHGQVDRRGLCGDVYLCSTPLKAHINDVKIMTSVRRGEISFSSKLENLTPGVKYSLKAFINDKGNRIAEFKSRLFTASELRDGILTWTEQWKPDKLWDVHSAENMFEAFFSLFEEGINLLDTSFSSHFGFREFWIEGRDFYLNGTRIFLSAVPFDNAQVGAALSTYEAAKESMRRLMSFGINFVYSHNYGCEPGTHLAFGEILKAADDVGMLIALSQPHFGQYNWTATDADDKNGYAHHAEFYTRVAHNHPSVVFYSMSHNACGYNEDMDPEMIDGLSRPDSRWSAINAKKALRAEAIVARLDPGRIIYHHSSGNLGSMHTINFYPNWVPIQEMCDWFQHWATVGVKPVFLCEYAAPFSWDWSMYRGWYKGKREFGSAPAPWEFCLAEWNSQFLGDKAFQLSEFEKVNLRWEAKQFEKGSVWYRWDYPYNFGSSVFEERNPVLTMHLVDQWRAFRTWGLSANSPWDYSFYWKLKKGTESTRKNLITDWENLQRPGYSPDFNDRADRFDNDIAFDQTDWIPTAALALIKNNKPLLAYIGGKAAAFTSKDHNFLPGTQVEKQLIIINNSRLPVTCDCSWTLYLPEIIKGGKVTELATGQQERIALNFDLPLSLSPGNYDIHSTVRFSNGEIQEDSFSINALPSPLKVKANAKIALFDPKGETRLLLDEMGIQYQQIDEGKSPAGFDLLIIGKEALTIESPGFDAENVRYGLKIIVFEQTSEVLEKRFGFRVQQYGLRRVFKRISDHPVLHGLDSESLHDWQGAATLLTERLKYQMNDDIYNGAPTVRWCDIPVTRIWRCGNRGNVASVLIEKPSCGDFRPVVDGGYSLQYSPLMEYREGKGLVMFCQLDVTGRTETDPAAMQLAGNILSYVSEWKPEIRRQAFYAGDEAGKRHIEKAGYSVLKYENQKLSPEQVLIVARGAGQELISNSGEIANWIMAGGRLLGIGLNQEDTDTIFPSKIRMKKEEHIAAFFDALSINSPFAGIGPSDVHNRAPKTFSLVSAGATIIGNGILANVENTNLVFCQTIPWEFDYSKKQHNIKQTYRRSSFLLSRVAGNLGIETTTPLLHCFNKPLDEAKAEKRWLDGLYLDQPEEWDDPYRFFRW